MAVAVEKLPSGISNAEPIVVDDDDHVNHQVTEDHDEEEETEGDNGDEDDSDNDSDYVVDEEETEEDDEDVDEEEYLRSLAVELETTEEHSDVYLQRMLEDRESIEGEDAEWVDKYIQAQKAWKDSHGSSIDEIHLPFRLADLKRQASDDQETSQEEESCCEHDGDHSTACSSAASGWRSASPENLITVFAALLFVVIAFGIQFHFAQQSESQAV